MNKLTRNLILSSVLFSAACGGGSETTTTQPTSPKRDATCSARISASKARWAVTGERLTLTAPTGESLTLKRVQSLGGGRAIYGQWLLADEPLVRGIMQITATSVTSIAACKTPDGRQATASAVSPARITDTEIEILESHEERLTFSEPLVDDADAVVE
jgi:hypothetical protein